MTHKRLKAKYEAIAALTRPKCMQGCPEAGGCCHPRYCLLAEVRAEEFGLAFPRQSHPTLKYMGPAGCVVPPYLRPLCAVHVCEPHVMRADAFSEAYLELREEVCKVEEQDGPTWPMGMARNYWQ